MKAVLYAVRSFGRELRSGEVIVLLAAVALAVAALTAVGFLTDRIGRAVARQANEVLAADLRLRSPDEIPAEWHELAARYELQSAETQTFPSVVFAGEQSSLATIKGVSDGYPLRGAVTHLQTACSVNNVLPRAYPPQGQIWADGALMARLNVSVGERISVGETDLQIACGSHLQTGSIDWFCVACALTGNQRSRPCRNGLIAEGSRVRYALLVAGEESAVDEFYEAIEPILPDSVRSRNREEGSDRANNAADRAQRFLSLTAVISLLLSAVAIAMSATSLRPQTHGYRSIDEKSWRKPALCRCRGPRYKFSSSECLALLLGSVVGFVMEKIVTSMLADIIQGDLPAVGFSPVLLASASAMVLLIGFALPSLIQLRDTPPLRVLRHDEMPPPPSRMLVVGTALIAVTAMLYQAIGDASMLLIVLGGMSVVSGALYVAGRLLVAVMGRSRGGVGIAWRYGLANISRRGRDSAVQVVAFGLGLTVLLLLTFVRTDLLDGWQQTLDKDAPNHFLINIQPQERASVAEIFQDDGIAAPVFVPLVRARMQTINGEDVKTREYPVEDGKWMANREQNLTWAESLSSSNEIVAGEWWAADYAGDPLVSLEEEAATELGVELGDQLKFLVAGQEIELTVASFRTINWDSISAKLFHGAVAGRAG